MDKKINRKADAKNSNGKADDGDDGVDGPGFCRNAVGVFFFGCQERREFLFERGVYGVLVFELKREPAAGEFSFPFFRQTGDGFGVRRLKAKTFPERRAFLRPEPEDAVIGGERLDAFPKQLPRGVGGGKIGVAFAVEKRVSFGKLNPDRADNLPVGMFDNLKFSQALFQFIGGQAHGIPNRPEGGKVVHGGTADAKACRTHRGNLRRNSNHGNCN